jgi:hypothetical protein
VPPFASTTQFGLTQVLGAMGGNAEVESPYQPPSGVVAEHPTLRRAWSVAHRLAAWALISLLCALGWAYFTPPATASAGFVVAFLAAPALWLVWPDFRAGGFRAVSSGRFLLMAGAALGAACIGTATYLLLVVVGLSVWAFPGHGT